MLVTCAGHWTLYAVFSAQCIQPCAPHTVHSMLCAPYRVLYTLNLTPYTAPFTHSVFSLRKPGSPPLPTHVMAEPCLLSGICAFPDSHQHFGEISHGVLVLLEDERNKKHWCNNL